MHVQTDWRFYNLHPSLFYHTTPLLSPMLMPLQFSLRQNRWWMLLEIIEILLNQWGMRNHSMHPIDPVFILFLGGESDGMLDYFFGSQCVPIKFSTCSQYHLTLFQYMLCPLSFSWNLNTGGQILELFLYLERIFLYWEVSKLVKTFWW